MSQNYGSVSTTDPDAVGANGATGARETTGLLGHAAEVPTLLSSLKVALFGTWLNVLLIFVPLGIIAGILELSDQVVFSLNFLAIVPLAKLLGTATEELALKTNQTIGGLLNATFGNLVEAIVAVLALNNGLVRVVQASLLGSILSNLLLVLGFSFLLGGIKNHPTQHFNAAGAQTAASLLAVTVLSFLIPAALVWQLGASDGAEQVVLDVSRGSAIVLFFIYIFYLVFQLKTHPDLFKDEDDGEAEEEESQMTTGFALGLLLAATLLVSFSAEYLVESIDGISEAWNLSETFVGLVLLPIVGNAAEHVSAVSVAMKNKMNLVIGIAVGSSMQIALFVTPICVIAGWVLGQPMTLAFTGFETAVVFVSIFVTNSLISDGTSNWLEGAMLLGAYIVIAIAFWKLPS